MASISSVSAISKEWSLGADDLREGIIHQITDLSVLGIIWDSFGECVLAPENSYTVVSHDFLANIDPIVLSAGIIGIALIAAVYMAYHRHKRSAYARYDARFN